MSKADPTVSPDELTLRRRARRRLVGAIAIALSAVVVLPMLFDPEPKPLGAEVDVHIPAQDSPFEPDAPRAEPQAPLMDEPARKVAEPTQPLASPPASPAMDAAAPAVVPAATPVQAPVVGQTAEAGPVPPKAPPEPAKAAPEPPKPVPEPTKASPVPMMDRKEPAPSKAAARTAPAEPQPEQGYYLQLGAFGSESNAKQLQGRIKGAGFKAGLSVVNGQFRVRVGPVAQRDKALDYQAQLKSHGFEPVLIGP